MKDKSSKNSNNKNSEKYQVPKKGSLGLLAVGHKGIRAWRKVLSEDVKQQTK